MGEKINNIVLDINDGRTLFVSEKYFDSIYEVSKSIIYLKDAYYNVFTGEKLCSKKYSYNKSIETDELLFVQVDDNLVYQINKITCEIVKFGQEKVKEEPIVTKQESEEEKIIIPKQNRNDVCNCGSGKKFKNCCLILYK